MTRVEAGAERREVSCLALTLFYDYLESAGIARAALQTDLPYDAGHLDDRSNWIDYETFLEVERRMTELLPKDPDLFFKVGAQIASPGPLAFLQVVSRAVISPFPMYAALPRIVPQFLFPHVKITVARTSRTTLSAGYVFDEGYAPSEAWLETTRGILSAFPGRIGGPPAEVTMTRLERHRVRYDVSLRNRWLGPVDFLRRVGRRVLGTLTLYWRNVPRATAELEETNRLLNDKVHALSEAKAALDVKVRELSSINALARTVNRELDLDRLVTAAVQVVSRELDDAPAAILLADGEPPGLAVTASAWLERCDPRTIERLIDPDGALSRSLVETHTEQSIDEGGQRLRLLPMTVYDELVGALLLVEEGGARFESQLLEPMVGHLAVALHNAASYQLVADLRDNLELRVIERTAELEAARSALELTVQRLERSDRIRQEFFTNVSHEFRTPLTLILAPLDVLAEALRSAGRSDVLASVEHIRRNGHVLLRMINQILDLAKADAHTMPLHPEDHDLDALLAELVESLRPMAEYQQVSLTYERPQRPVVLACDGRLIRSAAVNLLFNAIKYVEPHDEVTASIATDGSNIRIAVADTGPGIPATERERIFERFVRVNDNRGRVIQGSGIGLAYVKEIVGLHRGAIRVLENPGGGAVFEIILPAVGVAPTVASDVGPTTGDDHLAALMQWMESDGSSVETPLPGDPPREPSGEPAGERARVLVVEDNPEMQRFLSHLISGRHVILSANDGREALDMARVKLPDVILSDVMMPRMDGYELCSRLKAHPVTRNIPVMLISAMHGTEASLRGFQAGADDFVVKPFSPPELMARINAQIRLRRLSMAMIRMEKQSQLGIMAAGIAHEVLNPLNGVLNAVHPLRESLDRATPGEDVSITHALLDVVEESSQRINDVVNAMLTLSRTDTHEQQLRESRLSRGIESLLTVLRHRIGTAVTVHCDLAWDEPLLCYPNLLYQAISNLVLNAVDAVGERGNIWISTRAREGVVEIRVRDDGPGIAADARERIFLPFYTTKDPGAGTGLGLAISREIVGMHGGSLELGPSGDGGAEFILRLPKELPTPSVRDSGHERAV